MVSVTLKNSKGLPVILKTGPLKTRVRSVSYLQKAMNIGDDIAEDKVFVLGIKPAQFGDPREQRDQALDHERRKFGLVVQIGQNVIADIDPLSQ